MGGRVVVEGILEGIRILDLAEGIAGSVAAMLLAESGADVVKVEAPGSRTAANPHGSLTWDRSKRSVVLDVETPAGAAQLDTLLGVADVVIHEYGPARAEPLGLDDATLRRRHRYVIA